MGYVNLGTWSLRSASSLCDAGSRTEGRGHAAGSGVSNSSLKDTAMSLPPSAEAESNESFVQGGPEALLAERSHALNTFHSLQPFSSALQIAACSDRMIPKSELHPQELRPALQSHPKVLRSVCLFGTR